MIAFGFEKRDAVAAIAWMLLGALITLGSYKLGIGKLNAPGPGLMPFLLGILLTITSLPVFIYSLWDRGKRVKQNASPQTRRNYWRVGMSILAILIYGLAIERIGFSASVFCSIFFLLKVASLEKPLKALLISGLVTILAYFLFVVILKVPMPSFPWVTL